LGGSSLDSLEQARQRVLWIVEHEASEPSNPSLQPRPNSVDLQDNS
jgi:hypothetical protein